MVVKYIVNLYLFVRSLEWCLILRFSNFKAVISLSLKAFSFTFKIDFLISECVKSIPCKNKNNFSSIWKHFVTNNKVDTKNNKMYVLLFYY